MIKFPSIPVAQSLLPLGIVGVFFDQLPHDLRRLFVKLFRTGQIAARFQEIGITV